MQNRKCLYEVVKKHRSALVATGLPLKLVVGFVCFFLGLMDTNNEQEQMGEQVPFLASDVKAIN